MSRKERTATRRKNYHAWKQEHKPQQPPSALGHALENVDTPLASPSGHSAASPFHLVNPVTLFQQMGAEDPGVTAEERIAIAYQLEKFAASLKPNEFQDVEEIRNNMAIDIQFVLASFNIQWPQDEVDVPTQVTPPPPSLAMPRTTAGPGHSTGPRTPEGLARSSQNARKHGLSSLTSAFVTLPGEDPYEWDQLVADLLAEFKPASRTERILVTDMAQSHWLTQRAINLQTKAIDDPKALALFLRYQTTHHRAYYRALQQLLALKKSRAESATPLAAKPPSLAAPTPDPKPSTTTAVTAQAQPPLPAPAASPTEFSKHQQAA